MNFDLKKNKNAIAEIWAKQLGSDTWPKYGPVLRAAVLTKRQVFVEKKSHFYVNSPREMFFKKKPWLWGDDSEDVIGRAASLSQGATRASFVRQ